MYLRSADECIEQLIMAGGNTHLAAERLFPGDPNAVASLVASIAQDPLAQDNLNAQLRTLTTLRAFDALTQAQFLLPTALTDLEAADFAKFYTALLKNVSELATPPTTPTNPADAINRLLQVLPPEGRRAFLTLVGNPTPSIATETGAAGSHELGAGESADLPRPSDVQPILPESEDRVA